MISGRTAGAGGQGNRAEEAFVIIKNIMRARRPELNNNNRSSLWISNDVYLSPCF